MGIFDRLFNNQSPNQSLGYTPKTEQEAWVALMYACAGAEGDVSLSERDQIIKLLIYKTIFNPYRDNIVDALIIPASDAQRNYGSKVLIDSSVSLIKTEDKETIFCLIFDILLADGILGEKEKEIAEYLIEKLNIDEVIAGKIIEVLIIKNKYSVIITE